jgi:hypothetical protein
VLCAFCWKEGIGHLWNFHNCLQNKEPLTSHGTASTLTSLGWRGGASRWQPQEICNQGKQTQFISHESSSSVIRQGSNGTNPIPYIFPTLEMTWTWFSPACTHAFSCLQHSSPLFTYLTFTLHLGLSYNNSRL